nr:GspJ family type II secretion system protein [uncultured Desulfuromonas sp.]
MTRSCSTDRSAGFTLIEVLVAIMLLSLVMTTVYGVFSALSTTQKRLQGDSEAYHQARVIFDRLAREIRTCYLDTGNSRSTFSSGIDSLGQPYLEFASTSVLTTGHTPGGVSHVRYALETDLGQSVGTLYRSAQPLYMTDEVARRQRMSNQITRISWRFYDGNDWQDEWDSSITRTLPQTVEMQIVVHSATGQDVELMTAFDLTMPKVER